MNIKKELLKLKENIKKFLKDESTTIYEQEESKENNLLDTPESTIDNKESNFNSPINDRKNLESEKFRDVQNFMLEYDKRKNLELERQLFEIVSTEGKEELQLVTKSYEYKSFVRTRKYNELKRFLNSLTQEQIESNIYLNAALIYMQTSVEDCSLIIENLKNEISNLEISDKEEQIDLYTNIPIKRLKIILKLIFEQVKIQTQKENSNKENKSIYEKYNEYVRNMNKLVEDIYLLQMWNLVPLYPYKINNYYFKILNNDFEYKFKTSFAVKDNREKSIKSEMKTYQLSDDTKKSISEVTGVPVSQIDNMSLEDLLQHSEEENTKQDLISGPKLVLKRNNNTKEN